MGKREITILTLILVAEIIAAGAFLSSRRQISLSLEETRGNSVLGIPLKPQELPQKILLVSPEKQITLSGEEIDALEARPVYQAGSKLSSLENYLNWKAKTGVRKTGMMSFDEKKAGEIILKLVQEENRNAQDAELVIEDGRATKFTPHQSGKTLDGAALRRKLIETLASGGREPIIDLSIKTTDPKLKLGSLNDLGIRELMARGQSDFSGSSRSRIHNIKAGASRYNGVIIKPGEEFSFNKHLGTVDGKHGFLPELVIKPEGTVPEFGGGLCQVSTTAFRAAFFGGLPISQRKNHSYAVKYYEWIGDDKPRAVGLDATIYPGAVDMKFINDTKGAILIWTKLEGSRLYFDFYGTPDERTVVVDGPHPYDRKPSGAVKSKVGRKVIKDGQIKEAEFSSNYVSPDRYPRIYEYPKPLAREENLGNNN